MLTGCEKCERFKPQRDFTIEGKMINSKTGKPISNWPLRLEGYFDALTHKNYAVDRDTTDSIGYFKLQYTKRNISLFNDDKTIRVISEASPEDLFIYHPIVSTDTVNINQTFYFPLIGFVDFDIKNKALLNKNDTLFISFTRFETITNFGKADTFFVKDTDPLYGPNKYKLEGLVLPKSRLDTFVLKKYQLEEFTYFLPTRKYASFQGVAGIGIKSVEDFINGERSYSDNENPHTFNLVLEEHNQIYQVEIDIARLEKP